MSQEALKYGSHIPKIQIHQDGFTGKVFPSAPQPQQWRCLTVALLCLLGESEPLGVSFPSPGAPGFQPKSSQLLRIPNSPQISRME